MVARSELEATVERLRDAAGFVRRHGTTAEALVAQIRAYEAWCELETAKGDDHE